MAGTIDRGGRREAAPGADASCASTAWSIPEIRVIRDEQGRLRIDESDSATYGAYAARQFVASAKADTRHKDGMSKRPSAAIKITYLNGMRRRQEINVREIFVRVDGDALVLTEFENEDGQKVKDLPIPAPVADEPDADEDDADRLHDIFMAELGDGDGPSPPAEVETAPEPEPPAPTRERRLPTGPLRTYDEPTKAAPAPAMGAGEGAAKTPAPSTLSAAAAGMLKPQPTPGTAQVGPGAMSAAAKAASVKKGPPAPPPLRALDEREATALRALIEAKAGETRWASVLLMQAAERHPSDRKLQNEHLAKLMQFSVDPLRSESKTPLGIALRGVLEEVHAYKAGVLDRDPLKAEKVALLPFARTALAPPPAVQEAEDELKVVSGTARRTPAQVLAKLEDAKLARATRVKLLMEIVPELIESWKPDKESGRSEAGNEFSPAIMRRMFAVANEQRQQRKFIDDGASFKKATERYAGLEGKLPKASADES